MPNAPKFIPPNSLVEITLRTNAAQFFLRPSHELNLAILAILGRALALYPVALHAFVFMSNHWHALVTPCDGDALRGFKQFVHSNVAKAAKRINKVKGKVWAASGSKDIHVLEDDAQIDRLKYLLAHGTKEGLVESPLLWPGLTSARALVGDEVLVGEWEYRDTRASLSRSRVPERWEYTERFPIHLTPLPVHATLTAEQIATEVRAMLGEIETAHPGPFLGVAGVLAQDPNGAPVEPKQARAPAVHTKSKNLRIRFRKLRAAFREDYRNSALRHHSMPTSVRWNHSGFLPTVQFVTTHRSEGQLCDRRLINPPPTLLAMLADFG